MTDKILKIAKRLKTFTLEDIVMFTGLEINACLLYTSRCV